MVGNEFSSVWMVVEMSLLTADSLVRCLTQDNVAVCSTRVVDKTFMVAYTLRKLFVSEFKCALKHICN